jgi:hypothetical protein
MSPTQALHDAIKKFDGVDWVNFGDPKPDAEDSRGWAPGWVKFGLKKSEAGWRTLEFLAWAFEDMVRGKNRLFFFPISAPPYLNEPGATLAFVVECYVDSEAEVQKIQRMADLLNEWFFKYWPACKI